MPFIRMPGIEGLVYVIEEDATRPRKHHCLDCDACQMCSDSRCRTCRRQKECSKRKRRKRGTSGGA